MPAGGNNLLVILRKKVVYCVERDALHSAEESDTQLQLTRALVDGVVTADTSLFSLHLALSGSCASSPALHTCSLCLQFSGGSQALWLSHLHGLHPPLAEAVFLGGSCMILGGLEVTQPSFDQLLREHIVLATYLGL